MRMKIKQKSNEIIGEKSINLEIKIIDTGLGISEQGLKQLFMDFGKLSESEEQNKGGTGLGLSICKQIVEKMGGNVTVSKQLIRSRGRI